MKLLEQEAEDQLIQRLYAKDEQAMTFFYKNYKRALYQVILRIVRQEELAEDVLQESMLKFWLAFPTYDASKGRLFTWALNISRNMAIDRLREQRRTALRTLSLSDSEVHRLAAAPTFRPEHIGVRDWLVLLAPSDQQLLELLYMRGYTQAEVADELHLPLGTVKSRGRRIIRTLAQMMK